MKLLVLFAAFVTALFAQTAVTAGMTVAGPATVYSGQTVNLTVSIAGTAGENVAGVQWQLTLPAGATQGTVTSTLPSLFCGTFCVGLAYNQVTNALTTISDSVVATVPVTIGPTVPLGALVISLNPANTIAVANTGMAVSITAAPTPYSIKVLSKCDVNGDGKVDFTNDALPVIKALIGNGTCPLSGGCTLQTAFAVLSAAAGNACTL